MGVRRRAFRRLGIGCGSVVLVLFGFIYLTGLGGFLHTLISNGFLENLSPQQTRKYNASTISNLKALYTAMSLYHESEGQYPVASGWMDGIKNYVHAADLAEGEAEKKFVSPSLAGQAGKFGYAMNDLASGKYKKDIRDPKTPLIFDSSDTSRNAHGDPKKLTPSPPRPGGNLAISVDGTILKL